VTLAPVPKLNQPGARGRALRKDMNTTHTPTPWHRHDSEQFTVCGQDGLSIASTAVESRPEIESDANLAFIVRAVNSHAALVEALDSIEATAVNLHCALQSTAHMDPNDSRIPTITGQVVKDLLVLRDQARAALQSAKG
jgi:hypothetical protein